MEEQDKKNPYLSTHAYMRYDGSQDWGNEEWFKIWKQMAGIKEQP